MLGLGSRARHFVRFSNAFVEGARVFGPKASAIAMFRAQKKRPPGDEFTIVLPGLKGPIQLRAGTSDPYAFVQTFMQQQYTLEHFAQNQWIDKKYNEYCNNGGTPLIIDCGANIGLSAVWFANRYPRAIIYAIEPSRQNFNMLCRNTAGYPNIKAVHGGVWDQENSLSIVDENVEAWAFQVSETSTHVSEAPAGTSNLNATVQALPINKLRSTARQQAIFIAKIDIEGGEEFLFRSNIDWLDDTDLLIMELHDWMLPGRCTSDAFLRSIVGRSFDFLHRGENVFLFKRPRT